MHADNHLQNFYLKVRLDTVCHRINVSSVLVDISECSS